MQFDVLVDEGEGPFQAHAVDVAQVPFGVAAADAPCQPVAEFGYLRGHLLLAAVQRIANLQIAMRATTTIL